MNKAVEHFKEQLAGIHFGVPSVGFIDTIKVVYHGQPTPIKHLATTCPTDGRIKVEPYDRTILGDVERALKAAGLNAHIFSKTSVVVNLPKMVTAADRDRLVSHVKKLEEEAKVAIRNVRKKARQKAELTESEQQELQKQTDDCIQRVAELAKEKIRCLGY